MASKPSTTSRSTASLMSANMTDVDRPAEAATPPDVEKLAPMAAPPTTTDGGEEFKYDLKFWTIMLCNFLALFLVALDRTILATAVPRITDEFHSLGDVGWYGSAYMLTTSASQLMFGRIYKFYSTKWIFLICVVVFEVGSAICGAAPDSTVFIVGRAIAGCASAGIFTGCMMIFMMVPLHKRPMFQGLFGMVFGLASVMGPLIGGGFTGSVNWRWCFYINLPIGAVSFVLMVLYWNPPKREIPPAPVATHIKRLDPLGTFFLLPAVVSLLLALQWGGSTFAWNSATIIALFVVFGILIGAFATVQIAMPETATIPPKVITQRSVFFGALFTFFLAGSMLIVVYYLPIWFQTAQGVDPLRSGIFTLPLVLSLVVSSITSGIFTSKIGYYVPSMLLAPVIMSIGEGLMTTFTPNSPSSHWIAFQFLTGFGLGFGMQTSGLAVQTVLPVDDVSTGVAIIFFVQQLGGAVFTSVGQAILSNLLVSQLTGVDGLDADTIVNAGITNLLHRPRAEDRELVINAYNFACTRIFLAAMCLTFGSLVSAFFMEWRNIKKPQEGSGGPTVVGQSATDAKLDGEDTGDCVDQVRGASLEAVDQSTTDAKLNEKSTGDSAYPVRAASLEVVGGAENQERGMGEDAKAETESQTPLTYEIDEPSDQSTTDAKPDSEGTGNTVNPVPELDGESTGGFVGPVPASSLEVVDGAENQQKSTGDDSKADTESVTTLAADSEEPSAGRRSGEKARDVAATNGDVPVEIGGDDHSQKQRQTLIPPTPPSRYSMPGSWS